MKTDRMKLSWSHKLFLWMNKRIGTNPIFDRAAYLSAEWLIAILAAVFIFWAIVSGFGRAVGAVLLSSLLLSSLLSYGMGYLWRQRRPEREFPMIKTLVRPFQSWKSFPSDHAILVTLMVAAAHGFDAPAGLFIFLLAGGILVAAARVYAGVHYPRDILGGVIIALISLSIIKYFF